MEEAGRVTGVIYLYLSVPMPEMMTLARSPPVTHKSRNSRGRAKTRLREKHAVGFCTKRILNLSLVDLEIFN